MHDVAKYVHELHAKETHNYDDGKEDKSPEQIILDLHGDFARLGVCDARNTTVIAQLKARRVFHPAVCAFHCDLPPTESMFANSPGALGQTGVENRKDCNAC